MADGILYCLDLNLSMHFREREREQRAESREQRAESREQRAESREREQRERAEREQRERAESFPYFPKVALDHGRCLPTPFTIFEDHVTIFNSSPMQH